MSKEELELHLVLLGFNCTEWIQPDQGYPFWYGQKIVVGYNPTFAHWNCRNLLSGNILSCEKDGRAVLAWVLRELEYDKQQLVVHP